MIDAGGRSAAIGVTKFDFVGKEGKEGNEGEEGKDAEAEDDSTLPLDPHDDERRFLEVAVADAKRRLGRAKDEVAAMASAKVNCGGYGWSNP